MKRIQKTPIARALRKSVKMGAEGAATRAIDVDGPEVLTPASSKAVVDSLTREGSFAEDIANADLANGPLNAFSDEPGVSSKTPEAPLSKNAATAIQKKKAQASRKRLTGTLDRLVSRLQDSCSSPDQIREEVGKQLPQILKTAADAGRPIVDPTGFRAPRGRRFVSETMYEFKHPEFPFMVELFAFSPHGKTNVHNHKMQGVEITLEGVAQERVYDQKPGNRAKLHEIVNRYPFESDYVGRQGGDTHSVGSASFIKPAVTLHVYFKSVAAPGIETDWVRFQESPKDNRQAKEVGNLMSLPSVKSGDSVQHGNRGVLTPGKVDNAKKASIRHNLVWGLEPKFAFGGPPASQIGKILSKPTDSGQTLFEQLGPEVLSGFKPTNRSALSVRLNGSAPRLSKSESDCYDTPSFDLFKTDPTMAMRSKMKFDENGSAKALEIQLLSSSVVDENGIEHKGNVALTNASPTAEEAGELQQSTLDASINWNGEAQPPAPQRAFRDAIVDSKRIGVDDAVAIENKMHYRGVGYSQELPSNSDAQLDANFASAVQMPTVEGHLSPNLSALKNLVEGVQQDPTPTTVDALRNHLDTTAEAGIPENSTDVFAAANAIWMRAAERTYLPDAAAPSVNLQLKLSSVIDPQYWEGLPAEERTPQHQPPSDKVHWGWLTTEATLAGGFSPHVEKMQELRAKLDDGTGNSAELSQALAGIETLMQHQQTALGQIAADLGEPLGDLLSPFGLDGGEMRSMPDPGSKYAEWSPRKDWYSHLLGE